MAHSNGLAMAHENFLMEVDLYGSPRRSGYADYGHLATEDTWFQNLWVLIDYFGMEVEIQDSNLIQGARMGDRSIVSKFFCLDYQQLVALNIVWLFRNLLRVSDIVQCDGITLEKFVILDATEASQLHVFSREDPTPTDFRLWEEAMSSLCSDSQAFPTP